MKPIQLTREAGLLSVTWMADTAALLVMFTVGRTLAEQGASLWTLGLVGAIMAALQAVTAIASGRLSDRMDRRGFVLIGVVAMLAGAACALGGPNIRTLYFLSYALLGAGLGLLYPSLLTWLIHGSAQSAPAGRISPTLLGFCLAFNLGIFSGQAGGGLLFPLGRHWPLVVSCGLLAVIIALVVAIPRPSVRGSVAAQPSRDPSHLHQQSTRHFTSLSWVANLGSAFTISMVLHLFPHLAVAMGINSEHHGLILAAMRGVIIGTYLFMHFFRFWRHRFVTSLVVQGVGIAALLLVASARGIGGVVGGLLTLGILIGHNYFASLYYSTNRGGDRERRRAAGMHEGTLGIGIAMGSLGGGIAGTLAGDRVPYLVAACVILVVVGVQIAMWRAAQPLPRVSTPGRSGHTRGPAPRCPPPPPPTTPPGGGGTRGPACRRPRDGN